MRLWEHKVAAILVQLIMTGKDWNKSSQELLTKEIVEIRVDKFKIVWSGNQWENKERD